MIISDQLRKFFYRKAKNQSEPPFDPPISINITQEDEPDELLPDSCERDDQLGYAEGQSFIIEYVDAKGNETTRRITVFDIQYGASCPLLVSQCHERKAKRSFRVDRIRAVYDFDGVVQEPLVDFFIDEFGMSRHLVESTVREPAAAKRKAPQPDPAKSIHPDRMNAIKALCRKRGVPIFCLLARADKDLHPAELAVLHDYAKRCCESASIKMTHGEKEKVEGYLRRLRPSPIAISRCLDQASDWSMLELKELLETCAHIVKADGHVHQSELQEFSFIVENLTGERL